MLRSLAFVVCLLVSSSAFAQESTVLTQLSRVLRDGATQTASVLVPLDILLTRDAVLLQLDIPTDVYENPTTRIKLTLYFLNPTKGMWQVHGSATFTGGRYVDPETGEINPLPVMEMSLKPLAGLQIRGEVETNALVPIGLTVLDWRYPTLGGATRQ